jgi:hypothetical protein
MITRHNGVRTRRFLTAASLIAALPLGSTAHAGAAPLNNPADLDKLMGSLPAGFSAANCGQGNPQPGVHVVAVAGVTCDESDDPSGPVSAKFLLYADTNELEAGFRDVVNSPNTALATCPQSDPSPTTWQRNGAPGQPAGSILCGIERGDPDHLKITWTDDARLTLNQVYGNDITNLYQWWTQLTA